jgi:hypothetical protein
VFDRILETQLVLTGIMSKTEWKDIKNYISYDFQEDNYYAELKEQEILSQRMNLLQVADAYVGRYYSQDWIRRNVLKLTEDEIQKLDDQIGSEQATAPPPNPQQQQDNQKELPAPPPPIPQGEPPVPKDAKNMTKEELELIQNMSKLIENVNNENEDNLQDDK